MKEATHPEHYGFKLTLVSGITSGLFCVHPEPGEYQRISTHLGIRQGAVSTTVYRLRQRFRALVRDEVAQTVDGYDQIEDEMRSWVAALVD